MGLAGRVLVLGLLGPVALVAMWADEPAKTDPDRRIAFYRERKGGPGTYMSWARLGQAYLDRGHATGHLKDLARAERCLGRSLEYQPNLEALRGFAALRLEQHRFGEALSFARDAVAAGPFDGASLAALFDAHLALGQLEPASQVVERMLSGGPSFEGFARRSLLARRQGDLEAATEWMGQACDEASAGEGRAGVAAWCEAQRGELARLRCAPEEAERAYARALDLVPGHALAREHLAELREGQGRLDEAIALYEGLLVERPSAHLRVALADAYAAQGDERRAAEERSRAVREMRRSVASGRQTELRGLALLLLDLDDPRSIEEGLGLAERDWRNRQDALAADTLAWARFRRSGAAGAFDGLEAYLDERGLDPGILVRAATILTEQGRAEQARRLLERLPPCSSALSPADRDAAAELGAHLDQPRR